MTLSLKGFKNFFKYYAEEEHQVEAIETLYESLPEELKSEDSLWVRQYRNQVTDTDEVVLDVPYYSQRDNYRDAYRTCFSSSVAMTLTHVRPGSIRTDDDYIKNVFSVGDTTEAWVHTNVLWKYYGVSSRFVQNANIQDVKDQIDKGIPVPCGILHKGRAGAPSGGGHWICVIGYSDQGRYFVVHDPFGELDDETGTYISSDGSYLKYSYAMMDTRWTVDSFSDGWCLLVS